jgi:sugar/nucleoside kinase (ribokinase family)
VDTNGAGDAFCAGYIAGLLAGQPLPEAVLWGNAWAAVALGGRGATAALSERHQLFGVLATAKS